MIAASLAIGLPEAAMLVIWGLATFVLPGAVLLTAAATPLASGERIAFAFAASLALLTATFAACLVAGVSIGAAPAVLALVTLGAAMAARRLASHDGASALAQRASSVRAAREPALSAIILVLLTLGFVLAAVAFAPVGSVDRWWYLAYVRGYLDASTLTLSEPFLGTGQAFARFGIHPWLFGLATWSSLSGVDPVAVYERGAPVLVVLASVSASHAMASELFRDAARARLCVMATMLLWSGALLPVLARAGEDKILAASVLSPLCFTLFLRISRAGIRSEAHAARCLLLFAVAAATAAVHALAYAFVLVTLLPAALLVAWSEPARRRATGIAVAVLLVVALAPAASGLVVRERLGDIGAELATPDHPVVRVHEARERLVDLPLAGYVVSPRLLLHPLALLALAGLPLLRRRRFGSEDQQRKAPALDEHARKFLVAATVVPLAIAFVPPLPSLAGSVIPPWMVYRVLWLLPLAPLAVLAVDRIAQRFSRREAVATMVLLVLGLPMVINGARGRLADARMRLAAPAGPGFRGLVDAVGALPVDALVVAAPELSERLPSFAARPVVAALDRSTIVFAASRDSGEARLRARSALLAGAADAAGLAALAGIVPTHAVFDPRSRVQPRCGAVLFRHDGYALCELAPTGTRGAEHEVAASGLRDDELERVTVLPSRTLATVDCRDADSEVRRDPWSAAAPIATCRLEVPAEWRASRELFLVVDANAGRGIDELRIHARYTGAKEPPRRATVRGKHTMVFRLPASDSDTLEVQVTSAFLPYVRARVAIAAR